MTRIIIHGASGKMGAVVATLAEQRPDEFRVVAGIDHKLPHEQYSFPVYQSWEECHEECDAIIDFSLPDAQSSLVKAACARNCGLVVATTGISEIDRKRLYDASKQIAVFNATNMSLGVNVQIALIKQAASVFGEQFDIEIVEKHHNQKIDAPSGTALTLAEEIAGEFTDGKKFVYDRSVTRQKRSKNEIGISSVRGGTIVGEHSVLFIGEDEVLEVNHIAHSKRIFAVGALQAAAFVAKAKPGFYGMNEMLAEELSVNKVSAVKDQSVVTLNHLDHEAGRMADAFDAIADINIDMISQTVPNGEPFFIDVSFTLPSSELIKALSALESFGTVSHRSGLARFTIEGPGMEHKSGVAAGVFRALTDAAVEILLVTTSETKISFCIDETQLDAAFAATKTCFGIV